jgi:GH25 family lysozyme M1 (1,4-beta-N-acetylmuramidase)
MPPLADLESFPGEVSYSGYADRAITFLDIVTRDLGTAPIIYTFRFFADEHLDQRFGKFPLFLADFSASARMGRPKLPKWWTQLSFWDVAEGVNDNPLLNSVEIVAFKKARGSVVQ